MFPKWLQQTISFNFLQQTTAEVPCTSACTWYQTDFLFASPTVCTRGSSLACTLRTAQVLADGKRYHGELAVMSTPVAVRGLWPVLSVPGHLCWQRHGGISSSTWQGSGWLTSPAGERDTGGSGESSTQSAVTVRLCAWWRGSTASTLMSRQRECGRHVCYVYELDRVHKVALTF